MKPIDIVRFDEKISPHEISTLCEKLSGDDDIDFDDTMDTNEGEKEYNMYLNLTKCFCQVLMKQWC